MRVPAENQSVEEAARQLIESHQGESTIDRIYLFPSEEEVRLVEVDRVMSKSDRVYPYYFGAMPAQGIRYPVAIALIRPEEYDDRLQLPDGWGNWEDAELIWERRAA